MAAVMALAQPSQQTPADQSLIRALIQKFGVVAAAQEAIVKVRTFVKCPGLIRALVQSFGLVAAAPEAIVVLGIFPLNFPANPSTCTPLL